MKSVGVLLPLLQGSRQPIQALVETIAGGSTARLDVPSSSTEVVETKLVGHLRCAHRIWQVLLVGENQENRLSQLVLIQHAVQFIASSINTVAIVRVHHEDETLSILVVVPPQRADLVTSHR